MFPFHERLSLKKTNEAVDSRRVFETLFPLLTEQRRARIEQVVQQRCFSVVPVLENIYDRGNINAVTRSAEACGLGQIHIVSSEKTKDSQRITAGAEKWVESRSWPDTATCLSALRGEGKQIIVTALTKDSVALDEIDFSMPTALLLGNEKGGASEQALQMADRVVMIPMLGFVQSFNISVAAALCFAQVVRWRKSHGGHADLNDEQREILKAVYAMRTLDSAEEILLRNQK